MEFESDKINIMEPYDGLLTPEEKREVIKQRLDNKQGRNCLVRNPNF